MSEIFGVLGTMDDWKKGDLPGNQTVNIVLNSYARLNNGSIAITAELASDEEVDCAIDQITKELEFVRKKAKEKIKKTNEIIRSSLIQK